MADGFDRGFADVPVPLYRAKAEFFRIPAREGSAVVRALAGGEVAEPIRAARRFATGRPADGDVPSAEPREAEAAAS